MYGKEKPRQIDDQVKILCIFKGHPEKSFEVELTLGDIEEERMTFGEFKEKVDEKLHQNSYLLNSISTKFLGDKDFKNDNSFSYYADFAPFFVDASRLTDGKKEGTSFRFYDISEGAKILHFSESAPKWRHVSTGLNLHGICTNKDCMANSKEVISKYGLGIFNSKSEDLEKVRCPICNWLIEPTKAGFYDCLYTFIGKKKVNGNFQKVEYSKYVKAFDDRYIYFGDDKNKESLPEWKDFKFITCKIGDKKEYVNFTEGNKCILCDNSIDGTKSEKMKCGHEIHEFCKNKFEQSGLKMDGCLLCPKISY